MPKLTSPEILEVLAEPGHLLRLATVDGDGMPRIAPVWFTHRADGPELGTILFTPRERSAFFTNLQRDARLALSIDEDVLPYRKVSVQGSARIVHAVGNDDEWRDVYREIARRFLDSEGADRYLAATHDQPRALMAVDLDTSNVTTWRMPIDDEPGTGIWATRYYADGSRMSRRG